MPPKLENAETIAGPSMIEPTDRIQSPWMRPKEAAAYLGVALGTLRNWTSAKFIPYSKRGGVVRYHKDAIDRWLNRGACPGRATLPDN